MFRTLKIAAVAAAMFLATALPPARAADTVTADDAARFLAGMMPSANSPLLPLTKDPAWQHHARFFDTAFAQLEQRQLSKIRAWATANLAAPKPTMFYMFSGPDFLYADAFYSNATTYVLSALEPPGSVPDLTRLPRGGIGAALYNVERSLGSILSFSFFITKKMKVDLRDGQLNGTLPILYVFLARTGKTIRNVSPVALDDKGTAYFANENPGANATRGVRIVFAGSDGRERTLYYFGTNVANDGFKASGFAKFCERLGTGDGLVKSASYLLHDSGFSDVRNFLLTHTRLMLQDDTGVPVTYLDRGNWQLRPFGHYIGPISIFPGKYQPRLARVFDKGHESIDFGIGYRWRSQGSNLLMAVRTDAPPPGATASTQPGGRAYPGATRTRPAVREFGTRIRNSPLCAGTLCDRRRAQRATP